MGLESLKIEYSGQGRWDFVLNTIPAVRFKKEELSRFGSAALFELASPPYGFDMDAAAELGIKVELAGALPSRFSPISAAEAIKDAILEE